MYAIQNLKALYIYLISPPTKINIERPVLELDCQREQNGNPKYRRVILNKLELNGKGTPTEQSEQRT